MKGWSLTVTLPFKKGNSLLICFEAGWCHGGIHVKGDGHSPSHFQGVNTQNKPLTRSAARHAALNTPPGC